MRREYALQGLRYVHVVEFGRYVRVVEVGRLERQAWRFVVDGHMGTGFGGRESSAHEFARTRRCESAPDVRDVCGIWLKDQQHLIRMV